MASEQKNPCDPAAFCDEFSNEELSSVFADPGDESDDITFIGPYVVREKIGEGGSAEVFAAFDENGLPVAIKVWRSRMTNADRARVLEEASRLSQLKLDCVPIVRDVSVWDGDPYMVTDEVRGVPLDTYCAKLKHTERLEVLARVADAVQRFHDVGVIHRDLKPDNILIHEDHGGPVVLDFGIATTRNEAGLVQPHGTPGFWPPEQSDPTPNSLVTVRSDIFALGRMIDALIPDKRRSADLTFVIQRATAVDPAQRYGSAAQLADDLRHVSKGAPIPSRRAPFFRSLWFVVRTHRVASLFLIVTVLATTITTTTIVENRALIGFGWNIIEEYAEYLDDPEWIDDGLMIFTQLEGYAKLTDEEHMLPKWRDSKKQIMLTAIREAYHVNGDAPEPGGGGEAEDVIASIGEMLDTLDQMNP